MRCRLCGHEFDPAALACHTGCPLGSGCNLICCPHCGYQVVDDSRSALARAVRRIWPSARQPAPPTPERGPGVPLTHVAPGVGARVERLVGMPPRRLSRLTAFGLAPGSSVRVLQHKPVPVVAVGESEIALSEEILGQIRVTPGEEGAR